MAVLHHFLNSPWLSSHNPSPELDKHQEQQQQLLHFVWRPPSRKLTITASSTRNPRIKAGKSVKSNEQLYNELQEFISMAGLPQGHVPSFKELSHHGRKDLANIVRRRGYKFISQLLGSSIQDTNSCENESVAQNLEGGGKEMSVLLAENLVPSSDVSGKSNVRVESGASLTLLEKASKFIKDGELDNLEDADDVNVDYRPPFMIGIDEEVKLDSSGRLIPNDEVSGEDDKSEIKISASTSSPVCPLEAHSDGHFSADGDRVLSHKNLDVKSGERENEDELDHLKAMLRLKEMELQQLQKHIEKEKLALSALKAKTDNEIRKAEKIMLSKDDELQNAAESLSGLKEVQIEYRGHGEIVEVTGSFNGWHDRIKMDSHPLPISVTSTEPRNSRLWSTVLWLYPGIYEIKFVVDGDWRIDPQMETVCRGAIHNNVLRVALDG